MEALKNTWNLQCFLRGTRPRLNVEYISYTKVLRYAIDVVIVADFFLTVRVNIEELIYH